MRRVFRSLVLAFPLCLVLAAGALAGPLEDQLFEAAKNGDAGGVKALLDKGANVNAKERDDMTPLMAAAINGRVDVVKLMIGRGADVNARDAKGRTALKWADDAPGMMEEAAGLPIMQDELYKYNEIMRLLKAAGGR